jgi:aspartyl protease family protein
MNGDDALGVVYLLGCLILVGSALAVRRMPVGEMMRMALAWAALFAIAALILRHFT